jgi:hypothetical protein
MKDKINIVSNVWIRQIELEHIGDEMGGHSHTFDHQHLLSIGKLRVQVGDAVGEYEAPAIIFIRKGLDHTLTAMSDYTLGYCIHPIRDGYRVEDIIDPDSAPVFAGLPQGFVDEGHKFIDTPAQEWGIDKKELK